MQIADETLELIRNFSKNDTAYHQLVTLFEHEISQASSQKLRHSESNVNAILNSTWHSFTLIDRHGIVIDSNEKSKQSAQVIFGKTIMPGATIYDFVLPHDHDSFTMNFARALQGETIIIEKSFATPTGSEAYFEIAYYPVIADDEVVSVCLSYYDITERKQTENRLALYKNVISSTQDGMSLVNQDYIYEIVNDAYLKRANLQRDQIEGHSIPALMGEEVFQNIVKPYIDRCLMGEIITYSEWFDYPSLGQRYINVSYFPYYNEAGEITGVIVSTRDETDQKQAQDYLQAILNNSPNGIMAFEAVRDDTGQIIDFRCTLVNQRAEKIAGRSQANMLGKHLLVEMADNLEEGLFDLYVEVVETGKPLGHEHNNQHEQSKAWFHSTAVKFGDGFVITVVDITNRKRAEQTLRDSEREFRTLAENSPDNVQRLDRNGKHLYANGSYARALGRPVAEIIGKTSSELGIPDHMAQFFNTMRQQVCTERKPAAFDFNYHTNGEEHHFSTRLIPEFDEHSNIVSFLAVSRDITNRKRVEETLRQSEREFRTLAENSPDNIQRLDRNGKHLYVNASYAAALGLPVEQIVGKTNEELGMSPVVIAFFAEIRERAYTSKQPVEFDFSYPVNDEIRYFNTRMIPEFDSEQNIISLLSVSRDVTERKQVQERELALKLEQERHRMLTNFVENAAHEFRTPLATINSSAYLLLRSDDPERRIQKSEQIGRNVKQITNLVDSLLLMTRLESNAALSNSPVNLVEILQYICEKAENTCTKNHTLHDDIALDLPSITGDADDLSQALQQIIDNACRFTPNGGKIEVYATNTEDRILIEVRDNGLGIAQAALPHIFETFWRQDVAHTTPGFGLGLPIARKIIERHGGEITIISQEGQGTTVRVSFLTPPPQ